MNITRTFYMNTALNFANDYYKIQMHTTDLDNMDNNAQMMAHDHSGTFKIR